MRPIIEKVFNIKTHFESKVDKLLYGNIERFESLETIESCLTKSFTLTRNFDDYCHKRSRPFRLATSILICILNWLFAARFVILIFIEDQKYWNLLGDVFYLTHNRKMINFLHAVASLFTACLRTNVLVLEANHKFNSLEQIVLFKKVNSSHSLWPGNYRKIRKLTRFLEFTLIKQILPVANISTPSAIAILYYVAYKSQEIEYSAGYLCFWWFAFCVWALIATSALFSVLSIVIISLFYLKYRFIQIDRTLSDFKSKKLFRISSKIKHMEQIVNPRKTQLGILVQAIEEHDQVCQITHDYSKSLKFINMLVYVATTLVIDICIYVCFFGNGPLYFRVAVGVIGSEIFIITYFFVYLMAIIAYHAHKPNKLINTFLAAKNEYKIPLNDQWTLLNFVERLGGPTIGFYCYDMFPFNDYYFYQFVTSVAVTYFLLLSFLKVIFD